MNKHFYLEKVGETREIPARARAGRSVRSKLTAPGQGGNGLVVQENRRRRSWLAVKKKQQKAQPDRYNLREEYGMFRTRRDDTLIRTIEAQHGIDFNARGDMTLGNLLSERGFDSLTQLLNAYHGRLPYHARKRRLFLSFRAEDKAQVQGFRLMAYSPNTEIDFYDGSVRQPVNSERSIYIRKIVREKIRRASVVVCLIGNGTAWRDWVDWELRTACEFGKGICGVRLKDSRGRTPPLLVQVPLLPVGKQVRSSPLSNAPPPAAISSGVLK